MNRSHSSIIGAALIVSAACAHEGRGAAGDPGPRLVCDEPEHFFGSLDNTRHVDHEFILRNEGDEPLEIFRVRTACGCMATRLDSERISPGGETALRVRLSLKGRDGKQRHRVTVKSNDRERPRLELTLSGEALAALTVRPERLFWGNIREDASSDKTVEISFRRGTPVRITGATLPSPMFAVETRAVSAGEVYELRIRTLPPLPLGVFDIPLTISTDCRSAPEIVVPMNGRVVGELFSVPREIALDIDSDEPATRFVIVRSSANKRFRVLRVEPPCPDIRAGIRTTGSSRSMIDLKNMVARPELDGSIVRIVTDLEAMEELLVPIRLRKLQDGIRVSD